jgi:TatD DNase family protein
MDLTDTHCHIQSIGLQEGERTTRELWVKANLSVDQVIAGAHGAGVNRLLCVGCDLADSQLATDFVRQREGCWATVGIHPHEAQHFAGDAEKLAEFAALADRPKVVAVGECGLDFYYNHSPRAAQIEVLRFQIELALRHDLPLIFHVREAFDEFWPVFDSFYDKQSSLQDTSQSGSGDTRKLRGVLHSFTDSADNLAKALERGLHIGVNGIATFAKDPALLEVYRSIPLEKLLLETDAPFLAPNPHRGKVNQPKYLVNTAEFLATLRGENLETLALATTANPRRLFKLDVAD